MGRVANKTQHTKHSTHTAEQTYTQHTAHNAQHRAARSFVASSLSSALQLTLIIAEQGLGKSRFPDQQDGRARRFGQARVRSCGRGRYRSGGGSHNAQVRHGSAPTERPSYGPSKEGKSSECTSGNGPKARLSHGPSTQEWRSQLYQAQAVERVRKFGWGCRSCG